MQARIDAGRARRETTPLGSLAALDVGADRPDPIVLLTAQDEARLPGLVPIRHARMAVSAFTFYRGGAAIMASDLSRTPSTDLRVQLCGDAHLSNFGIFNAADRRLVFDINDFDETSPGPFEWDLKRLAASVTIAGRNNDLTPKQIRSATRAVMRGYRQVLAATLSRSPLDVHYTRIEVDALLAEDEKLRKRSGKAIAKATRKDSLRALQKLTVEVDGVRRIVANPPLIVPLGDWVDDDRAARVNDLFERYRASLAPIVPQCSIATASSTWRTRWSASAASAPGASSCCSSPTRTPHCSSSSRRRPDPCWSRTRGRAATTAPASGSCAVSG